MKAILPMVLVLVATLFACSGAPPAQDKWPDPGPAEAEEVRSLVRAHVASKAGADGVYAIPRKDGGAAVPGTLTEFHTVHQKDADTLYVCADFVDGDTTYDVDFFVDRDAQGLKLAEHFLHKINGEVVTR